MFRRIALALLLVVAISQVAEAGGPLRFALKSSNPDISAEGSLRITNGKPTDRMVSVTYSVTGLTPGRSYCLKVKDNQSKDPWWASFFADETGSFSTKGTQRDVDSSQIMAALEAVLEDSSGVVVLYGKAQ